MKEKLSLVASLGSEGKSPWKVVRWYLGFSALWILLSDRLVAAIFADVETVALASIIKGWLFVGVTSALLWVLIERLLADYRKALALARQHEEELQASRQQMQATLDALPDLLFEVGRDGRIYQYHSHRSDLLAAPPEVFMNKRFDDILPSDASNLCHQAIEEAHTRGFSTGKRYALNLPQGECWFELSVAPLGTKEQPHPRFILISRDITERYNAEKRLEMAGLVFNHASEGIMVTDAAGLIVDVNEAFTQITGYARAEALGRNPSFLSSGQQDPEFFRALWASLRSTGYWRGEIWNRRKDGQLYVQQITISSVRNEAGNVAQYVALLSDITALRQYQDELEHIAHYDRLTGLPNRLLLSDRLQQAMVQADRRSHKVLIAFVDIDDFKDINDTYGHEVGDRLLVALGQRIREHLREGDTLSRPGGDEFVAVLPDLEDAAAVLPLVARLIAAAADPFGVDGLQLKVSISVGLTSYPQVQALTADQLLRQADQAMYQAKLAGKNRYHMFDSQQDHSIREHFDVVERVRLALHREEFVLYVQPKVNMRTAEVLGGEMLLRWQHPERGLLAPASFLPAIEGHELSVELGQWVMRQAIAQHMAWRAAGLVVPLSVNVGALQLQQPDFLARLQAMLNEWPGMPPSCLELEILETSALQDMGQAIETIEACRSIGVHFALDDFGTGYSSLTYLRRLPVSVLKIDQSFVRNMLENQEDQAILRGVLSLASAFGREVIAEGVETESHGAMLVSLGCDAGQGYGIARPMPTADLPAWIRQWKPGPELRAAAA